jgi:hypothetical protein
MLLRPPAMTIARRLLVTAVCLAACTPSDAGPAIELSGRVTAGPTCPVVTEPPDPACEDRPVSGAALVVLSDGSEVARVQSDAEGGFSVQLPPGEYRLVPQPVEGLMGTAPPLDVLLVAGTEPDPVEVVYDTGIR